MKLGVVKLFFKQNEYYLGIDIFEISNTYIKFSDYSTVGNKHKTDAIVFIRYTNESDRFTINSLITRGAH